VVIEEIYTGWEADLKVGLYTDRADAAAAFRPP
jgi:hypothetical protein